MSLAIWESEYSDTVSDGDMSAPIIFKALAGGETIERRLYLRHNILSGVNAESSYGLSIAGHDSSGGAKSNWIEIADDVSGAPGAYAAAGTAKSLGDVIGGEIQPFWVRLTTPGDVEYGIHDNVKLKLSADLTDASTIVPLDTGSETNVTYSEDGNKLVFSAEGGTWISAWIDMGTPREVSDITVSTTIPSHTLTLRSSTDATDATATAWVDDFDDVPVSRYYQIKIYTTATYIEGVRRRRWNSTDLNVWNNGSVPVEDATGWRPFENYDYTNVVVRYDGYFYAPITGTYAFYLDADDDSQMWLNGELLLNNPDHATNSSASRYLSAGLHEFWSYYREFSGGDHHLLYVTPPGSGQREVQASDFKYAVTGGGAGGEVTRIQLDYRGANTRHYDVQVFDGPDVPEHISPPNAFETELFAPELTVYVRNCDEIEWQMDTVNSFDSDNLSQWTSVAQNELNNTSKSPTTDRPPGIWYWRARGLKNGAYSAWSDYWFLEILPLQTNDELIYLNVNVGLPVAEPIAQDRHYYANVNVGLENIDPIERDRQYYMNVNVDNGIGKIIYPIDDQTPIRKKTFEGDENFK